VIGLARMAARLAESRHPTGSRVMHWDVGAGPARRTVAECYPHVLRTTVEYYRIVDTLSRGGKP